MLISPEELLARIDNPALRICDVRWWLADRDKGRRDYAEAHLPGAVFVDLDRDLAAEPGPRGRHPLPEVDAFVGRMEALGIGDGTTVIAYDDAGGTVAARLWWMLDNLGFPDVHVLDGGIGAWRVAGGPVTAEIPVPLPGRLTLRTTWSGVIDLDGLADRLRDRADPLALLDGRAAERYRGEIEPVDAQPGHIPGAISRPVLGNLAADGRFLAPDLLRARFEGLPAAVAVACGSGVNACHNALAMRVAGLPDPLLYAGSYSEWAGAAMPVATGDEPGSL